MREIHDILEIPDLDGCIEKRFRTFHEMNPQVYRYLKRAAFDIYNRGHKRCGISLLVERLRWLTYMETDDPACEFKLCNDYRAFYARMLMKRNPQLKGFFRVREIRPSSLINPDRPFYGIP